VTPVNKLNVASKSKVTSSAPAIVMLVKVTPVLVGVEVVGVSEEVVMDVVGVEDVGVEGAGDDVGPCEVVGVDVAELEGVTPQAARIKAANVTVNPL
jgi:hypothetical protein